MGMKKTHLTVDEGFTSICGRNVRYLLSTDRLEEADCQKCLRISQTAHYWPIFHKNKTVHFHTGGKEDVYCGAVRDIPEPGPINLTDDPEKITCEACQRLVDEPTEVDEEAWRQKVLEDENWEALKSYAQKDVAMTVNASAPGPRYNRIHIQPRETWLENRLHELVVAIGQSKADSRPVPRDWVQEAHHILQELSSE